MDALELTVAQAAAAIAEGRLGAAEYAGALLAQAEKRADLNAFITLEPDLVCAAAEAADNSRAAGAVRGPLHGVPLALKDNIDTADLPNSGGTPGLKGHRPKNNAPVAQALIDAGALVLGKTNLHELAYGVTCNNGAFGPARNPYDPEMIPGGSSGGTGVAVAARMAPGGLGTDTGGSVRIPAAHCGLVGFRPTTGRYSQAGIVPISSTRDTAGPMTRSVADAVLLDGVISGGATRLQPAALKGLRLGVPRTPFWDDLDPETARLAEAELERLRGLGVLLVESRLPELAGLCGAVGFPVALHETVTTMSDYLEKGGTGLSVREVFERTASPDVHGMLMSLFGENAIPDAVYREALGVQRPRLQAMLANWFHDQDVAAMIFPTTPMPARPIGQDETVELNGQQVPTFLTYIRNTDPASLAGLPGLSLPIGLTGGGLPVGIELDAPGGFDRELLATGLAYEETLTPLPAP